MSLINGIIKTLRNSFTNWGDPAANYFRNIFCQKDSGGVPGWSKSASILPDLAWTNFGVKVLISFIR